MNKPLQLVEWLLQEKLNFNVIHNHFGIEFNIPDKTGEFIYIEARDFDIMEIGEIIHLIQNSL